MVDVTHTNLREWLPTLKSTISKSSFIAIDYEFLGIPTTEDVVSLFDSPETRYTKYLESVRKFPPCQLGIACFMNNDEGSYCAEVFSFPVFKRLTPKVFSFELPSMKFLAKHKFDFNKLVADGVSYANKNDLARYRKEIERQEIDYDIFADNLEYRIKMLKLHVLEEAHIHNNPAFLESSAVRRRKTASMAVEGPLNLVGPMLIQLSPEGIVYATEGMAPVSAPLWDRELSPVEASIVVYEMTLQFPNCEFHVDPTRTILYCAEQQRIFRRGDVGEERLRVLLENVMIEISGLSQLIHWMAEEKKPIIAHNSLLDLLYTYHCFEYELPEEYSAWKGALHRLFPCIIDTKIMAASLQDLLRKHGVTDFSLQTLGSFFHSPSCGEILPLTVSFTSYHSQSAFTPDEHYHNAAFDALITGEVFVKLAYLHAMNRNKDKYAFNKLWPLENLIYVCRADFANRIPVRLMDSLYCNLIGSDPAGERPHIFRLTPKRAGPAWAQSIAPVRWIVTLLSNEPTLISEQDYTTFRHDVRRRFGSTRVDARLAPTRAYIEIATNTANTFGRVCSWLVTMDQYDLPAGIREQQYEERLISASTYARQRSTRSRKPEESHSAQLLCISAISALSALAAIAAWRHFK
ncbi:unnamed protein product, partial [Mesorhabditis spiculigera]